MKTLKSLLMLCAGLSFCACSSDNEPQLIEGTGALTVKVSLPTTRAAVAATGDDQTTKVPLQGKIYVELTATTGGGVKEVEVDSEGNLLPVNFYGITGPSKVEAYVNGGKYVKTYSPAINLSSDTDPDFTTNGGRATYDKYDMQAIATGVPAYGSEDIDEDNLTNKSELYEGVSYQMYSASVEMDILVARVEYTVTYDFTSSKFSNLDFQGAYLDNIKAIPSANKYDYRHANDDKDDPNATYKSTATGEVAILKDYPQNAIAVEGQSGSLPSEGYVYAYNIYEHSAPHFKLWFNGATSSSDYVVPYQYAVVNSYDSGTLTTFKAGTIYRVELSKLTQTNLATKEDGTMDGVQYGIDVTVTMAEWDVADVEGSWSQPTQPANPS